ncbi:hypothetical protein A2U01_0036527, partial [Trifolium medium]|nr:hypothetical protein [Trifolium medium]
MDLSQTLRYKVLVERKGFAFFVDLDYENLPQFCSHCKLIGHHVGNCKKLQFVDEEKQTNERRKPMKEVTKVFVQTKNGSIDQETVREVINVENEKIEESIPANGKDFEVTQKNAEKGQQPQNIHLGDGSSTSKNDTTPPPKLNNQNRFAALDDVQQSAETQLEVLAATETVNNSQRKSNDNGKEIEKVLTPEAILKEQDRVLEAELNK